MPIEFTKNAEHITVNPPEVIAIAINCGGRFWLTSMLVTINYKSFVW